MGFAKAIGILPTFLIEKKLQKVSYALLDYSKLTETIFLRLQSQ